MSKCCVNKHSQAANWTAGENIPQSFDGKESCTEEADWEFKEGVWDWKPICRNHKTILAAHRGEYRETQFRPLFYVIHEELS